jgi:formylglycine-generating enzyme required for sulfatase activity
MHPPPAPIDVAALGPLVRGTTVPIQVTLPVALDNIAVYLPTTEGGVGAGICPNALGGDCLSIVGTLDLYGAELTTGGVATFPYVVDAAHPTNQVAFQAVALTGAVAYLSDPVVLPVLDLPVSSWVSPSTGMEMLPIEPGTFTMGCTADQEPDCGTDEYPAHDVTLTQGFYMGVTEVTQSEYEAVMGTNPSYFTNCGDDCPVEQVSWDDAVAFANALSLLDGLTPAYTVGATTEWDASADGYRLPSEAEWEYAARANDGTKYAGSDTIEDVAWYYSTSTSTTHPVAELQPNGNGLYDMSGNVWEWTWDFSDRDYYATSPGTDPTGPQSGSDRTMRGGRYGGDADFARVARRVRYAPDFSYSAVGFRLARTNP